MPSSACQTCARSEEHTSELQSHDNLVCRLLLEKKKNPVSARRTRRAESSRRVPPGLTTLATGPSRLAFASSSQSYSSVVLDLNGSVFFLVQGDMPPRPSLPPPSARIQ